MSQATVRSLARDPKKSRYALINIARSQLGLDEDTYRALLHSVTGKTSLRTMSIRELDQVINRLKADGFQHKAKSKAPPPRAGTRVLAGEPQSRKIRALWLSGYHLGVIRDPREQALTAFAKRLTATDALQWTLAENANDVIEALKDMLEREAGVVWEINERRPIAGRRDEDLVHEDRFWIVRAQWQIVQASETLEDRQASVAGVALSLGNPPRFQDYEDTHWHLLMEQLGTVVRRIKAGAS